MISTLERTKLAGANLMSSLRELDEFAYGKLADVDSIEEGFLEYA